MPATFYYYRLHVRNEADSADLLVLSSLPGDPNTLLTDAPEGEGQSIDPIMGTLEVGSYTWQAIDRYDGDDAYTITALLSDGDARNQLLSHKCIGRFSTDGSTWEELHTGYLNDLKLGDAKTYTFIVGDTDRREREAILFKVITEQFDSVSNIIGGPVVADPPVAWKGTPKLAWGPILDYGPARMSVIGNSSGGSPNPANLVNPSNRVTLGLTSGILPPRYLGFQGEWNGKIPNPAEYIDQQTYQYFEADAAGIYATTGAEQSQPWGSFPQLEVQLTRVSDSAVIKTFPIAQATKKRNTVTSVVPLGDEKALVANSNDWLIIAWDVATMGAQPSLGTSYDVLVRPKVISENNPLHIRGHPIDLHVLANEQEGIDYDSASAAATKTALGDLFYELRITEEWEYSKFVEMLKSSAGYAVRYTGACVQEFFPTRLEQPDEVDTITTAELIGDDHGEPKEVIFRVSEGSAIKGLDYKLKQFRLWSKDLDSASDRPIDGVVAKDVTINGKRRDESVRGSKIVQFDVPGMILLGGDEAGVNQPMRLRDWIIQGGEVIIDRAGWGWAEGEMEVLSTTLGQVGDYVDVEAPHQVNAKVGQDPITQRGGTRKVQIVSRTEMPGTAKLKVKDAGNLAQDPPEASDSGVGGTDPSDLPIPELSLAPSADDPTTIAVVTEGNVDDFTIINADTELQYLFQDATPASTDEGEFFGPLLSSTGEDTIDAPPGESGQTIWVRGRASLTNGMRGLWSDWISLLLGPDDEGTEGTLPPLSLTAWYDADGVVSASATGIPDIIKVFFLSGPTGGDPPTFADVVASAIVDATPPPPFTATGLITLGEGDTATIGAVGEDALGNRTQLALVPVSRSVDTGAAAGVPGNSFYPVLAGPPVVVYAPPAELRVFKAFKRSQHYRNTSKIPTARLQVDVWEPGPTGLELHLVEIDGFGAPLETGVFVRLDRENYPEPGAFLSNAALGDNTRLGLATKNGDGTGRAAFNNVWFEGVTSTAPPDSPSGDPPGITTLFDWLILSDLDVYADTALMFPQTTNNNPVAGIKNQVPGNTVNGLQASAIFRPLLDTGTTLNSYQSIAFAGSRNFGFAGLLLGSTAGTMFVTLQKNADIGAGCLWNAGGGGGAAPTNYDGNGIYDDALTTFPRKTVGDPSQDLSQPHIYAVRSKAGEWSAWINGVMIYQTFTNSYSPGSGGSDVSLGTNSVGDPFGGNIWLFGGVVRWLSDDEMATAFQAIADRYAITLP